MHLKSNSSMRIQAGTLMQVAKERVKALDRLRGLSIVYMLLGHMMLWTVFEEGWWWLSAFPLHDFIGGPLFAFVSGAGMTLSIRRHPETPASVQHLRSVLIVGLGILSNLGTIGVFTVWGWSILVALGIFRLIGFYAVKLPAWVRVVFIGIIIAVTRPLLLWISDAIFLGGFINLYPTTPTIEGTLAYILYSQPHQSTFFPYFAFFLAGTLFVDLLIGQPQDKQVKWRRIFLFLGLLLVTTGLILGLLLWTNVDLGDAVMWWLTFSGRYVGQIPSLASRNSLAWSLVALGSQFLLGLLFLKLEQQVYRNRFLTIYGEFSLTIYAGNALIFAVGLHMLSLVVVLPLALFIIILTWYLCWIWYKKSKGIYSLEWILNRAVKSFSRYLEQRSKSRDVKSGVQLKSPQEVPVGNTVELPVIEKPLPDASKGK